MFQPVFSFQDDIVCYLKSVEMKHVPKPNYMAKQPDITYGMRQILVDWLVEVGQEYKLQQETIYLAVNYIDRFLSYMSVQRAKLQLVGTACMFIAA
jgi:cyclin A